MAAAKYQTNKLPDEHYNSSRMRLAPLIMNSSFGRQASRFGVVGVLVTALHVVIASSLVELLHFSSVLANSIAFVSATLVSYLANAQWSFGTRVSQQSFVRFISVALAGFVLTFAISSIVDALGFSYRVAILLIVVALPALSFLLHRAWTFN